MLLLCCLNLHTSLIERYMCAMDPCLTPLGSPKSRALSHHKALQKINPIGHSIVVMIISLPWLPISRLTIDTSLPWLLHYHNYSYQDPQCILVAPLLPWLDYFITMITHIKTHIVMWLLHFLISLITSLPRLLISSGCSKPTEYEIEVTSPVNNFVTMITQTNT